MYNSSSTVRIHTVHSSELFHDCTLVNFASDFRVSQNIFGYESGTRNTIFSCIVLQPLVNMPVIFLDPLTVRGGFETQGKNGQSVKHLEVNRYATKF